jgi:hypothetical protein
LAEPGTEPSAGSVGDSYGNALAETINGFYKAEVIHRRGPWRSFEIVEFATLEWFHWFNHRRLLEPIGNIPPAEAQANDYAATAAIHNLPMAAQLNPTSLRQSGGSSKGYRCSWRVLSSLTWLQAIFSTMTSHIKSTNYGTSADLRSRCR